LIEVLSKDNLRYSYKLGIDKETGLLLQSLLLDLEGRVIERFQFANINIGPFDDNLLIPVTADVHQMISGDDNCQPVHKIIDTVKPEWRVENLPNGFMLCAYDAKSETERVSLLYSDGLSEFSVFIDTTKRLAYGVETRQGATLAYTQKLDVGNHQYSVTVVGEIPAVTAKMVATSVRGP
jgi:sigma-E factor negative regulatory protein RseB